MLYIFFGKEKTGSGNLILPNSPYSTGVSLSDVDTKGKVFVDRCHVLVAPAREADNHHLTRFVLRRLTQRDGDRGGGFRAGMMPSGRQSVWKAATALQMREAIIPWA